MDDLWAIDLGKALDLAVDAIKTKFPAFKAVVAGDEARKDLHLPAVLVQINELEPDPDEDPKTGQWACMARLEARVVMGHRAPEVRREISMAAGALAAFIHDNRLGSKWDAGVIIAVEPDEFAPSADQFDIWRVEWTHGCRLGEAYELEDGVIPNEVLHSFAPEIGPEHEEDYVP